MMSFFVRAVLCSCACVSMSCGSVDAVSPDVVGVSVRVDSTLVPIPAGFVIESVNVRRIEGEEVEELRFVSKNSESLFKVNRWYTGDGRCMSQRIFGWQNLLHFGDLSTMTEMHFFWSFSHIKG